MPLLSAFADLAARGNKNSQGFVQFRGVGTGVGNTTSSTNITMTITAQAGDLIVVAASWDPSGASTPTTTSVTDTVSTSYTSAGALVSAPATTSNLTGSLVQAYYGRVPSGVASQSITITWTWSGNTVAKAVDAYAFYNVVPALTNARTTTVTTATTATLVSGIANTGDVVVVVVGNESRTATTGASDTTNGSWSTVNGTSSGTSGTQAGHQTIALQYKIVTGQGTQTASWGGLANNAGLIDLVFKAA